MFHCGLQKYLCSQSPSELGAESEHNCLVIAELQKLASAFRRSGDQWRAYGYEKAIKAISAYGSEIKSYEVSMSHCVMFL
jgi:DNA polymerase lambda